MNLEKEVNEIFEEGLPNYSYFHYKGLSLLIVVIDTYLAVIITDQDQEWHLKEPIRYNEFEIAYTANSLSQNHSFFLLNSEEVNNNIQTLKFSTTKEMEDFLLRMLQALEYAEHKIYGGEQ